jgi:LacI family transcriptional regulator
VADSLSHRFSHVVGVVLGNMRNPFNTELLARLQEELESAGYFLINHSTDETYASEVKAIAALEDYALGAYVVAPVQESEAHDHLRALVEAGKTLVTIGEVAGLDAHTVDFDDQKGSRVATDHLITAGHKRIACLAGPESSSFAKHRILGYLEGLMTHRLSLDDSLIINAGDTMAGGYNAARDALTGRSPRPTALLCFNDLIAVGAYRAAYELGLSIPHDLSVVGFDDVELANVLGPPLTTVATYPGELGRYIAEIILTVQRDSRRRGFIQKRTQPKLVERRSVAPPPAAG